MYYPILKNANNEMKALKKLSEQSITSVTPIIEGKEIRPQDLSKLNNRLGTVGNYLSERVTPAHFIYDFGVQLKSLPAETFPKFSNGNDFITDSMQQFESQGLSVTPCFHFDSPNFIINTLSEMQNLNSIAIRVRLHDFQYSMDSIIVSKILSDLDKFPTYIEKFIILDYYNKIPSNHSRTNYYISQLSKHTNIKFIFASTNCPENAQDAEANAITPVAPRLELNSYKSLLETNECKASIAFGDYATRLEGVVLKGFNRNKSYLKIIYTTETDYLILKSKLIENNGEEDFYQICQDFIESPHYSGIDFSYGDQQIYSCANQHITIVPHQEPIAISVNHHIELTVNIIHSLIPSIPS